MRAHGAQVIVVLAHVPMDELAVLAHQVTDLHIPLMLGGHSHELDQVQVKDTGTWIVNSGCWWRAYSRIDLDYSRETGNTVLVSSKQVWLQQPQPQADRGVQQLIDRWQARMGAEYGVDLGNTASGITRPLAIANFIGACYLGTDPGADATLFNNGGFRQDITPGSLNKGVIISVMPFTNRLYRITVSGQQLLDYHAPESGLFYGLRRTGAQLVLLKTGQPVDPRANYHLLITDYLYEKSPDLKAADPHPVITAEDYRQPVYDWLTRHPSSTTRPLEAIVDLQAPVLEVGGHLAEYVPAL
jgi:2',3'-cyclic-nucleotide 2'-phosphodiesterase (5'-nucleotidase family)